MTNGISIRSIDFYRSIEMSNPIRHVSNYDEYIQLTKESACVIKFTADWCGPCKAMAPLYNELAEAHSNKANFLEVDLDAASKIANFENVTGIPLILFYDNGVKLDYYVRGNNGDLLINLLTRFFTECLTRKLEATKIDVHEKPEVDKDDREENIVVPPPQQITENMSHLISDDIDDFKSESENEEDIEAAILQSLGAGAESEYGEDCELPIEKTILEDMVSIGI